MNLQDMDKKYRQLSGLEFKLYLGQVNELKVVSIINEIIHAIMLEESEDIRVTMFQCLTSALRHYADGHYQQCSLKQIHWNILAENMERFAEANLLDDLWGCIVVLGFSNDARYIDYLKKYIDHPDEDVSWYAKDSVAILKKYYKSQIPNNGEE